MKIEDQTSKTTSPKPMNPDDTQNFSQKKKRHPKIDQWGPLSLTQSPSCFIESSPTPDRFGGRSIANNFLLVQTGPQLQYIPLLCPLFLLRFTVICLLSTKIQQTTQNKNQRSKKNHLHQWQPTQKEHKTKLGGTRRLATRAFCRVMLFTRYRYSACHQRKTKEN